MGEEADKPAEVTEKASASAREPDEACPAPATEAAAAPAPAEKPAAADKESAAAAPEAAKTADDTPTPTDKKAAEPSKEPSERTEPSLKMPPAPKRDPKIVDGTAAAKDATEKSSVFAKAASMFGNLDADQRIRKAAEQNERLLWAGAAGATLIYALLIASQSMTGMLIPLEEIQRQQEMQRRGQDGNIVSVEIVPEPDRNAKTTKWRDGTDTPAQQQPTPPMPPMPQTAALPEPQTEPEQEAEKEVEKEEAKEEAKHENKDEPRPEDSPMLLDLDSLVDAAAADLKQQIDRHYEKKKQPRRQQQAAVSGTMKVRGSGASGKSDPFTDSVIAALMKTRPGPVALWGRVLVTFQIGENGNLRYVRVLQSSGNSAMDQAAVDAIRRARFQRPPPGMSPDARTYIIDYIFG